MLVFFRNCPKFSLKIRYTKSFEFHAMEMAKKGASF